MNLNAIIIFLVILLALLIGSLVGLMEPLQIRLSEQPETQIKDGAAYEFLGDPMPDFTLQNLEGEALQASTLLEGKGGFVHFWASWCAPCVVEFPELVHYAAQNQDQVILALSTDFKKEDIEQFLKRHIQNDLPRNFVILHDPDGQVSKGQFQTFRLPETVTVDADLNMRGKYIGVVDWASKQEDEKSP